MDAASQLRQALERALCVTLRPPGVPAALAQEVAKLTSLTRAAGGGKPPRDHLREAVLHFRAHRQLPNLASARAVCFGASERFQPNENPLIEDGGGTFSHLLHLIDGYQTAPRQFRRCYRGLLHTYFVYDGERSTSNVGQSNWTLLRSYLDSARGFVRSDGVQPEWVETIDEHPNLVSRDPVTRYAAELLTGNTETIDQIRSGLDISDSSWLMDKLILAQIRVATKAPDAKFAEMVNGLMRLLNGHDVLEDEGLTLLLDRYATIKAPVLHAGLRDRSVTRWGNPWRDRNSPKWTRVVPEARRLVTNWLKLDLIREFFESLSEDRQTDRRRVRFWEKYYEQIDDMYFALGSAALRDRDADAKRMRERMGDHLLGLRDAGPGSNNAFIMMLGKLVVVEFGVKGHACFLYQRDALPFELRGEVSGAVRPKGLRSPQNLERLTHADRNDGKWETIFAAALARYGANRPSDVAQRASSPRVTPQQGLTKETFVRFCNSHQLLWTDNTKKGGNLAVRFAYNVGAIPNQLRAWGFAFSERKQFWWRKDWL